MVVLKLLRSKLLWVVLAVFLSQSIAFACTTVIAGINATKDHVVLLARNEDAGTNNWPKIMKVHKAKTYKKGSYITYPNGLRLPAPSRTLRYSILADYTAKADNNYIDFGERGINSANVAMTATNSIDSNAKAQKVDPFITKGSFIEENMTDIVLSRAKTAKQGVQLVGNLIAKYGAGEGNDFVIADLKGAWVVEVASAHTWVAVRVPDNEYFVMANGVRIHGVNLNDTKNVMHSPNLYNFTVKNHLLKNPSKTSFDYADAYGKVGELFNIDRVWLEIRDLTPSAHLAPRQHIYPMFLKPDHLITLRQVMTILSSRGGYAGTPIAKIGQRPISVDYSVESHILTLDPAMPKPLVGTIWQALGVQRNTVYMPLYNVLNKIPADFQRASSIYSHNSAWWRFRMPQVYAQNNFNRAVVWKVMDMLQGKYLSSKMNMDKRLKNLYKSSPSKAVRMARTYSYNMLVNTETNMDHLTALLNTAFAKQTERKTVKLDYFNGYKY